MKKFRVISDLHIDYNKKHPLSLDRHENAFTVICGDTSGDPAVTIKWVSENLHSGVLIAGNHLPYNFQGKTIQELRQQLADAFPATSDITYLDVETGTFSKEIDGILFIGTTMYSDFKISDEVWNPNGDVEQNMAASRFHMNDYIYGTVKCNDIDGTRELMPIDYQLWFYNAYAAIDTLLTENEKSDNPKPVVLMTHHALVTDTIKKNGYVDRPENSRRSFNFASYASDRKSWLIKHPSIKCYLYGHIHDIFKDYRSFDIVRPDKSRILVVNNCRGYVPKCHDFAFNIDTFVNTETWTIEQAPEPPDEIARKKKQQKDLLKCLAWLMA